MAKSIVVRVAAEQRREQWRRIVGRWQASGMSQAAFCRRQDIPVWKLAWWRRRLKGQSEDAADLFVPIEIAPAVAPGVELELALQGGRILRFGADVDPGKLATLVAALESTPAEARRPC
jgi:hypothetical protein